MVTRGQHPHHFRPGRLPEKAASARPWRASPDVPCRHSWRHFFSLRPPTALATTKERGYCVIPLRALDRYLSSMSPPFSTFSIPTIRDCVAAGRGNDRGELAEVSGFSSLARSLLCNANPKPGPKPAVVRTPGTRLIFAATGFLGACVHGADWGVALQRPGGPARHAWSRAPRRVEPSWRHRTLPASKANSSRSWRRIRDSSRTSGCLFRLALK